MVGSAGGTAGGGAEAAGDGGGGGCVGFYRAICEAQCSYEYEISAVYEFESKMTYPLLG